MRFVCLLLCGFFAVPPTGPAYQISGTVRSARDGSAIAHARLQLLPAHDSAEDTSDNSSPADIFSDHAGHFTLAAPGPGRWVLLTSARGYRQQGYLEHEQFQSALVLSPANPSLNLDLRLQPDAAVTGTVLDEAGEPVREARVSLFPAPPPASELNLSPRGPLQVRTTDDLGRYELSGIAPGAYRISVSARPWYASSPRGTAGDSTTGNAALDVVYPTTWYPGATDLSGADVLQLKAGDTRQADFSLLAVPATHVRVSASPTSRAGAGGWSPRFGLPQLERISGEPLFVSPSVVFQAGGQAELGGLSPGLYRVRLAGGADAAETLFLRITSSSPGDLDFSAAIPAIHVAISLEGLRSGETTPVTLTDLASGARFDFTPPVQEHSGASLSPDRRPGRRRLGGRFGDGRTLDVPPGQYRIALAGRNRVFLTGVDASGSSVRGNLVDLRGSNVNLVLHVETGPATVRGVCLQDGRPVAGAMVVLVPTSFGQGGSIPLLLRDESNSDGSFLLPDVVPGPYILVAIENGWSLNWRDPATLQPFLLHGIAVTAKRDETTHQTLQVQTP